MGKVVDMVRECVEPIIVGLDMILVDIEYKKEFGSMALYIYIDKDVEGGVSLDDCESVHRAIDGALDELDPTNGAPYTLNVSSPGLDRPLKTERDFKKNIGKDVDVSLYKVVEGVDKKKFTATLVSADDTSVTVLYNDTNLILNKGDIANIKQTIVF